MNKSHDERRKYSRYDSDLKIEFHVNFDVETKIDYRVKKKQEEKFSPKKYHAVSNNISAEGINFTSSKKLNRGDRLLLKLYVPASNDPVLMEGEVRWSHKSMFHKDDAHAYDTGAEVHTVNNQIVRSTVVIDKENNIVWSALLDSVFSSFKNIARERRQA